MRDEETITEGALEINRSQTDDALVLSFSGKSIVRDPAEFLQPLLLGALSEAEEAGIRLLLDFRGLTYMNSSTFTPLIKVLEKARLGDQAVIVWYDSEQKWQEVSFAALKIFATKDQRIRITAAE